MKIVLSLHCDFLSSFVSVKGIHYYTVKPNKDRMNFVLLSFSDDCFSIGSRLSALLEDRDFPVTLHKLSYNKI